MICALFPLTKETRSSKPMTVRTSMCVWVWFACTLFMQMSQYSWFYLTPCRPKFYSKVFKICFQWRYERFNTTHEGNDDDGRCAGQTWSLNWYARGGKMQGVTKLHSGLLQITMRCAVWDRCRWCRLEWYWNWLKSISVYAKTVGTGKW